MPPKKRNKYEGFLYLVIPESSYFVKIGMTTSEQADKLVGRYSTYYPSFKIFVYATPAALEHEQQLFAILQHKRLHRKHEYFMNDIETRIGFFGFVNNMKLTMAMRHGFNSDLDVRRLQQRVREDFKKNKKRDWFWFRFLECLRPHDVKPEDDFEFYRI